MGKLSNSPAHYFRSGIAIKMDEKPKLDERLAALNLKTVGELVNLFLRAEGVVEALAPVAATFAQVKKARRAKVPTLRQEVVSQLMALSPETLTRLIESAKKEAA